MKFKDFYYTVTEGRRNRNIIVVDVQPAYEAGSYGKFDDIIRFVNESTGKVLMYVNAEQDQFTDDTVESVKEYWEMNGFTRGWNDVTIVDKGYGYMRSWMDEGVNPSTIIKAIRMMFQMKIGDSRENVEGMDGRESAEKWRADLNDPDIPDDMLAVNWINVAQLKSFEGAYLVGGGKDECLREVTLIMNAFNINYVPIPSLIY